MANEKNSLHCLNSCSMNRREGGAYQIPLLSLFSSRKYRTALMSAKPELTWASTERQDKGEEVWAFSTIIWIGTWKSRA